MCCFFFIPSLSFHFCSPGCCIIQCFHGYINQFIELQLAVFNYKIPFHEIEETPHRTIWLLFIVFVECVFGLYGLFASFIVFFFSSVECVWSFCFIKSIIQFFNLYFFTGWHRYFSYLVHRKTISNKVPNDR